MKLIKKLFITVFALVLLTGVFATIPVSAASVIEVSGNIDAYQTDSNANGVPALPSGSYKLTGNITSASFILLKGGNNYTIDLNGYSITVGANIYAIFCEGATVTIKDSSAAKTGSVGASSTQAGLVQVAVMSTNDNSSIVIEGGNFEGTTAAAAMSKGTCTINGGNFKGSSTASSFNGNSPVVLNCTLGTGKQVRAISGGWWEVYDSTYTVSLPVVANAHWTRAGSSVSGDQTVTVGTGAGFTLVADDGYELSGTLTAVGGTVIGGYSVAFGAEATGGSIDASGVVVKAVVSDGYTLKVTGSIATYKGADLVKVVVYTEATNYDVYIGSYSQNGFATIAGKTWNISDTIDNTGTEKTFDAYTTRWAQYTNDSGDFRLDYADPEYIYIAVVATDENGVQYVYGNNGALTWWKHLDGTGLWRGEDAYASKDVRNNSNIAFNLTAGSFKQSENTEYADAKIEAKEQSNKFIADHLTKENTLITEATADTYEKILGGETDWNALSAGAKDAVNAALAPATYPQLLAAAKVLAAEPAANKFIADHLTAEDNSIITEATANNYAQIIGGETDWNALSGDAQAAVNNKLTAAGGTKTYPELLADAKAQKTAAELAAAKAGAAADIDTAAAAAKKAIDEMANLTDTEKTALKDKVDAAAAIAKTNIENAADTAAVTSAKDNGVVAINAVSEEAKVQAAANKFIADHLTAADSSIITAATPDNYAQILGGEEDWNVLADNVKEAVNAKLTAAGGTKTYPQLLADAKEQKAAAELAAAKAGAAADIDTAAAAAKKAIDEMTNLSDAEKTALKDKVDAAAATAKAAINAAADIAGTEKAKVDGLQAIDLISAKAAAMDELVKDANAKKAAMQALEHLNDGQKQALVDAVDAALADSISKIDAATTPDSIDSLVTKGLSFNNIKAAEAAALNTVVGLDTLTDDEKEGYTEKISEAAQNAITDISAADAGAADFADTVKGLEEAAIQTMGDMADDAIAANFVKAYVTGQDGKIYTAVTNKNADQILSGNKAWDALTPAQKSKVDSLITAANKDIEGAPQSYEEYRLACEELVTATAEQFVRDYLTGEDALIYKNVTKGNYRQILSGRAAWDTLSKAAQAAVNEKLAANGNDRDNDTYPEMASLAETVDKSVNAFIEQYLTGEDGGIYKDATKQNFQQILSGVEDWANMSQIEKDAVNAQLTANGGKTYEELIKAAETLANADIPQTGENGSAWLWMFLLMFSGMSVVATAYNKKRTVK